ncbi:nucleotidyltransferase family protein [Loktanella sp. DJP18]|uniref:nucleotidyltransferase family protein n=1 Tax=Loktanella sp. DJP18 TaxID=3409788 RepID=UPI003BB48A5A
MIPILILAAGQSSRMRGTDKLAEVVDGQPLLRRVAAQAAAVTDTFVALHHDADRRLALLGDLPVTPLLVLEAAEGQSGTLRGAVAQLPDCEAFLVVLADLPDITGDDMAEVIATRAHHPEALIWRGATPDGKPGHPILFDASLRQRFVTLSGDDGGAALVKPLANRTHLVRFNDDRARRDLDTPEDWAAWREGQ